MDKMIEDRELVPCLPLKSLPLEGKVAGGA